MPHILETTPLLSAVNDPANLPLAVFRRFETPCCQLPTDLQINVAIGEPLRLQGEMTPTNEVLRHLTHECQHFIDQSRSLLRRLATGTSQVLHQLSHVLQRLPRFHRVRRSLPIHEKFPNIPARSRARITRPHLLLACGRLKDSYIEPRSRRDD